MSKGNEPLIGNTTELSVMGNYSCREGVLRKVMRRCWYLGALRCGSQFCGTELFLGSQKELAC